MQTFLPSPSFTRSATVLDRARLGKQRVEVVQLLRALTGEREGWRTHPAAAMWRGYEGALVVYGVTVADEWTERGYEDRQRDVILDLAERHGIDIGERHRDPAMPPWLGDEAFHRAHRSNLRRKDPVHYGPHLGAGDGSRLFAAKAIAARRLTSCSPSSP